MLRYLASEISPELRVVSVSGESRSGTFVDGICALVTPTEGMWRGMAFADLKPGWYDEGGTYLGPAGKPVAVS